MYAIRPARRSDVPRIAKVAVLAFHDSTFFQYQRPYHAHYPEATIESYRERYRQQIDKKDVDILVLEAEPNADEDERAQPGIRNKLLRQADVKNGNVVVGFVVLKLRGVLNLRKGLMKANSFPLAGSQDFSSLTPIELSRDMSRVADTIIKLTLEEPGSKSFQPHMEVVNIAVHPAYQRKGYGKALARECVTIGRQEELPLYVSAAPMGRHLFAAIGFQVVEEAVLRGYAAHPEPVSLWTMVCPVQWKTALIFLVARVLARLRRRRRTLRAAIGAAG